MTLGGQMHDRVRSEFGDERFHARRVTNVGFRQAVARLMIEPCQRRGIRGISERVNIQHFMAQALDQMQHQGRSNEAATAGPQKKPFSRISGRTQRPLARRHP